MALLMAAVLTAFLLVATAPDWATDAVPRPFVLGALYGTAGVVGLLGSYARRPSLLAGGAIPLIPGAFLSWVFVTLPFLIPATLLLIGAARARGGPISARDLAVGGVQAGVIAALILVGGWAAIFGLTAERCVPIGDGTVCSSGAITVAGVVVAAACVVTAIAISIWSVGRHRYATG